MNYIAAAGSLVLAIGVAFGTIQDRAVPQTPAAAPAGDAQKGQQLFTKYGCYQCHGREAQGAVTGPRLGPDVLPYAGFVSAIRKPKDMPPYSVKVLTDGEIADLYAFVASRPQPPARIPLLDPPLNPALLPDESARGR